jgi:hypothetical protein
MTLTPLDYLAIAIAVLVIVAALVYIAWPAKVTSVVTNLAPTPAAPVQYVVATPVDPVEDLYRAFKTLEEIGKRQGLATIAGQFSGVHAVQHAGFIQAAIGPPPAVAPPVPKAPASPAEPSPG